MNSFAKKQVVILSVHPLRSIHRFWLPLDQGAIVFHGSKAIGPPLKRDLEVLDA